MKEIIALDEKLNALPAGTLPEQGIDVSRDERADVIDTLPEPLRAEIDALQRALNEVVPEPFDYFLFAGGEVGPDFSIILDQTPTAGPGEKEFDPERSIVEQVRALDWEKQGEQAVERRDQMDQVMYLLDRLSGPLPSAKKWQRTFREDIKEFVKEKRRDAGKIHTLSWDEEKGLMENEYADGEAFRAALPKVILMSYELISVVAFGKPLPVERIDALKAEAQQRAQEMLPDEGSDSGFDDGDDDEAVPEIEAEVISEKKKDEDEPPAAG